MTLTLPLSPGRYALLQMPSRNVSSAEWRQMCVVLEALRPGIESPPPIGQEIEPMVEWKIAQVALSAREKEEE